MYPALALSRARNFRIQRAKFHQSSHPEKYFDKILVANRGEIACRVMSTAKKMGIQTVAVHSDADINAKHVAMADEAVNIGPAPSSQSYLVIDKIVEACRKTGAQAVHPGYGFLSENNRFVAALEQNNVVFIGPNSSAMDAMGDKIHCKAIAQKAGVTTVPGFIGEITSVEHGLSVANEIGYPIIIKPSAGGGGKGMRIAYNDDEAREGFRLAKQESKSSFGDDRLLIERFIEDPRHIEIQVLCDKHGNYLYLNERECSIQRRNQKVIEEAPSTFLTPEVRKAMGEQAVSLCRNVNYVSAGTCEFLVDPRRNFYFLEMNTRLQVEHPVTEYITGLDIVEWMIKIAAGEKLTVTQADIPINGWAMEARVYAEDPLRKFLPQIGKLVRYSEPSDQESDGHLRVDSGILEGSEISVYYDPLVAKVITHGPTRDEAISTLNEALDLYVIRGVTHNVCLLRDILDHPRFRSGEISTSFIPQEYPDGFTGHKLNPKEKLQLLSLAAALHHGRRLRDETTLDLQPGSFTEIAEENFYVVKLDGEKHSVQINVADRKLFTVFVDGSEEGNIVDLAEYPVDHPVICSFFNDEAMISQLISVTNLGFKLQYVGTTYDLTVLTPQEAALIDFMREPVVPDTRNSLLSPMAGTLVSVAVKEGDVVTYGQELAVVEAMKMQNILRAQRAGKIAKVNFKQGETLLVESVILEFEKGEVDDKSFKK